MSAKFLKMFPPSHTMPRSYKKFSCSNQLKFFLVINVKMPTTSGILTFLNRKNSILGLSEPENAEFLDIFRVMSVKNFKLS